MKPILKAIAFGMVAVLAIVGIVYLATLPSMNAYSVVCDGQGHYATIGMYGGVMLERSTRAEAQADADWLRIHWDDLTPNLHKRNWNRCKTSD